MKYENSVSLNRAQEIGLKKKKNQMKVLQFKETITERKNSVKWLMSRSDLAEERISELKKQVN